MELIKAHYNRMILIRILLEDSLLLSESLLLYVMSQGEWSLVPEISMVCNGPFWIPK